MKNTKKLFIIIFTIVIIATFFYSSVNADSDESKIYIDTKGSTNEPQLSPYSSYVTFLSQNVLSSNSDKTQIRYLQKELNAVLGCQLDTNGILNSSTLYWIRHFQKINNLEVDGKVGPITRNLLNKQYKYKKLIVKSSPSIEVRNNPSYYSGTVIDKLPKGTMVNLIEPVTYYGTKWYKILYGNGKVGYIPNNIYSVAGTFVEVDIASQTLRFYKDSNLYLDTAITTGKKDGVHDTRKGYFEVQFIDRNRYLNGNPNAFVSYWMKFNNQLQGLHDSRWRGYYENFNTYGGTVYKQSGAAGTSASGSKGCVNIPPVKMPIIFNNAGLYTPVYVH